MKHRKYTNVRVWDGIYCTSTYNYFVTVTWLENGKHTRREMQVNDGSFDGFGTQWEWNGAPKYLMNEIWAALWLMVQADDCRVYEKDREGERRYENLRYHEPNYLKRMVGCRVGVDVPYEPEAEDAE